MAVIILSCSILLKCYSLSIDNQWLFSALVRHSSRHKRLQASVTASARGTIAEELIHVIRKLFLRPLWDRSISYVIEETLEKLAGYFDKATLALTVDVSCNSLRLSAHSFILSPDSSIRFLVNQSFISNFFDDILQY